MKKYILALDEGTTSARSILFDRNQNVVSVSQQTSLSSPLSTISRAFSNLNSAPSSFA